LMCAFRLYRPDNKFCKAYGLYTATCFPSLLLVLLWEILLLSFFWISFAQDFNRTPLALSSTLSAYNIHATKSWVSWFGFSGSVNTCKDFCLSIHPSLFGFLLGQPPVAQWSFLASLTTIAVGVALHNVFRRFFVKPCFHWVATRELRLITLWNPPTSVTFCYFGGRFFVGAPSFLFSLVRSTIVVHFWSAHFFYFVDFLKKISLALTWLDLVGQWQQ
jgi:hypothetical protein